MMRRYLSLALLLLLLISPVQAQNNLQKTCEDALELWDAGRYPDALEKLQSLMASDQNNVYLDRIALLTGELYPVVEAAVDGRMARWSPDGAYYAFEVGEDTYIAAWKNGKPDATVQVTGRSLSFSPSGPEAAYISVQSNPDILAQKKLVDNLLQNREFQAYRREQEKLLRMEWAASRLIRRNLVTGAEKTMNTENRPITGFVWQQDGKALFIVSSSSGESADSHIYQITENLPAKPLTAKPGPRGAMMAIPGGRYLIYTTAADQFELLDIRTGQTGAFTGGSYAFSADGSTLAYLGKEDNSATLNLLRLDSALPPRALLKTQDNLASPALSSDGRRVAYQRMLREDWELFFMDVDSALETRLTFDPQHDLFPVFLSGDRLLGVIGEGRHRRSFLYDLSAGEQTRLFHNNTIRTVAPEYQWAPDAKGERILIVSERDGDTISPERGVYIVDLTRKLTKKDIEARLRNMLEAERDLRARGQKMFEPIAEAVRAAVADASVRRIYGYASDLHRFGSKYITEPGNHKAIEYLTEKLKSFGLQVEQQWFEPRPGVRSANVIATLPGTVNPELVYVISSHFDSVQRGPGADDNSSGTTALLEAARVMASRPMPATIQFAFFTGEEAGLLGSREFVRQAVENKVRLVGALNNDMVGWANDHRLDDTIRYSNAGIRDVQHAAAFLFTDLITYDAKYYKSTDAHAYYDAYGDIVGGIGSYPILSSPHYHQSHDALEIINQRLVTEVSRTTIATIMLLASSPARLNGLSATGSGAAVTLSWTPAPEKNITGYQVIYGGEKPHTVTEPSAMLTGVKPGMIVRVRAVNEQGLESWDWAQWTAGSP